MSRMIRIRDKIRIRSGCIRSGAGRGRELSGNTVDNTEGYGHEVGLAFYNKGVSIYSMIYRRPEQEPWSYDSYGD